MSRSKPKKVLDLFCGAGGLALGFKSAGFETIAGIDSDEMCLRTFAHNFPSAKTFLEDLSKISSETKKFLATLRGRVDVILGGPPCQGFSIAGKRLINDPRNFLYRDYVGIVKALKPTYVVMENVPTIRTLGGGRIAQAIIEDLSQLGYNVNVTTVNASDYGVPQNRRRTFFIARHGARPISFPSLPMAKEKLTAKDALSDLPLIDNHFDDVPIPYSIGAENDYQKRMRKGSRQIFNHWVVAHTEKTKSIISMVPDGGNYKDLPKRLQSTRRVNIAWTRMASDLPSFTIDAGHNHHFHYKANRVPTVRECARIQSFPDTFVFIGNKTSQYRQVGNAVPPILAEIIANEIMRDLA